MQRHFDYLKGMSEGELIQHLDAINAKTDGRCLLYEPGRFTAYPTVITPLVAGLTFALDSNTFNDPLPPPGTSRRCRPPPAENRRDELEQRNFKSSKPLPNLTTTSPTNSEQIDDLWAKLQAS